MAGTGGHVPGFLPVPVQVQLGAEEQSLVLVLAPPTFLHQGLGPVPHDGSHQDFLHLGHTGALAGSAGNLGNHSAAGLLVADPLLGSKETFDS